MSQPNNTSTIVGLVAYLVVLAIGPALKLLHVAPVVRWSWWWVTIVAWGPWLIVLVAGVLGALLTPKHKLEDRVK